MRRKKHFGLALMGTGANVRMLCREKMVVAGLAAMNDADQPTPEECREVAAALRDMAEQARLPEIQGDLVDLALRFERMAALFELANGPGRDA
jgi:hypothetical protein